MFYAAWPEVGLVKKSKIINYPEIRVGILMSAVKPGYKCFYAALKRQKLQIMDDSFWLTIIFADRCRPGFELNPFYPIPAPESY